jgi:shikimate O-hydroxycinnamoyltransferase
MVADPRALALSPIEQVFTGKGAYPITFAFSFAAPLDARALRDSLAQTLRSFPLLACRLADNGSRGIGLRSDPSAGALRVVDEPMTLDAVRAALVGGCIGSETARFTLAPERAGSRLTVSISHAVVDGFAFMQFMYAWARVARGSPLGPVTRHAGSEGFAEGRVSPELVRAAAGAFWLEGRERAEDVPLRTVRRQFRHDELARQRAEARTTHGTSLSDNDLVCAHLWREFAPAGASPDAETFLTCPVDARPFCRQLGRTHFGCAITFATAALRREQLERAHPADVAAHVRKAVGAVDEQRFWASQRTLAALSAQHGAAALSEVHLTHPSHGLLVTNLTRLPLEGLDFGTGAPLDFEPIVQLPRCAVLFSIPGGVEARVHLPD